MTVVRLDTRRITDWESFHDVFAELFHFPGYYGRNLNAWIDCMTCLDEPHAELSPIQTSPDDVVVIHLEDSDDFIRRCPEQYAAIIECSSFVNWRQIEEGRPPILALSFYRSNF